MNFPVLLWKYLEIRKNRRMPVREFAERRLRKFRLFARFVNARSPYYARIIGQRGIDIAACFPEDFPVLTKDVLMENFDEIVTTRAVTKAGISEFLLRSQDPAELYKGRFVVLHTSGSSGRMGYFVYSQADWARGYAQFIRFHPPGLRRRRAAYFGSTRGHFTGVSQFLTNRSPLLRLIYHTEIFDINGPLQPVVDRLNVLKPEVLSGYPSGLLMLARKQAAGELRIAPAFVYSGGESLGPEARQTIEAAFPAVLLDLYDSTEHMLMAVSSPREDGMRLLEDDLIFEIHPGHTCITNLFNRTLPLIRYRMDDVLQPAFDAARPLPYGKIGNVIGRMEHALFLTNRNGGEDFISPSALIEFRVKNLRLFQIRVADRCSFEFAACLEKGLSRKEREEALAAIGAKLRRMLDRKEMDNVGFEITEADELQVDPKTGKFKLIINNL